MSYGVVFSPQAQDQLVELHRYISKAASPAIASDYTEAIVRYCEDLRMHPLVGLKRDDVRPGLRITNYRKRTVIAFHVDSKLVSIISVYYGGQDYKSLLKEDL